jgi:hypothetical protein
MFVAFHNFMLLLSACVFEYPVGSSISLSLGSFLLLASWIGVVALSEPFSSQILPILEVVGKSSFILLLLLLLHQQQQQICHKPKVLVGESYPQGFTNRFFFFFFFFKVRLINVCKI